ncbi:MAG: bifunctional phosphoribosylaminoimidazolecarboxamide formyltransferase/IMP cyclohydrolase [Phycisphaerae bacterium]
MSCRIKRALVSVHEKAGIVDFARVLAEEFGIELLSTDGTAKLLRGNGVVVTLVEQVTGWGEMLGGLVKTLHPDMYAAILADRDDPDHMAQLKEAGIKPIDMVVVNLYPFEETIARPDHTFEQAIEMIDIGGVCLLRAAAKNHKHVLAVSDPNSYDRTVDYLRHWDDEGMRSGALNSGAFHAFSNVSSYDAHIATWMSLNGSADLSAVRAFYLWSRGPLRYGENPHQKAELLRMEDSPQAADLAAASPAGEPAAELSFNNYLDSNAALDLCGELTRAFAPGSTDQDPLVERCCVFIKHTNACGVGVAGDTMEAYRRAYLGDPNAAMGGILACNFDVARDFAAEVMETYTRWGKKVGAGGFFVEVWVAPSFDHDAIETIRTRNKWGRRVRLMPVGDMSRQPDEAELDWRKTTWGMLQQTRDLVGLNEDAWKVVTQRRPTGAELADMRLAWLVCKHTRSNAISLCKNGMLIGNGAGQMSRVMSCRIATWLARANGHADALAGSAAASDGFFPFHDGPGLLIDAGVRAIIQPGGSKRDHETIQACDGNDVAMIFTETRHFKH